MGTIDILGLIKKGDMSKEQAAHLRKELRDRKKKLVDAIKEIDRGLKALARKPKSKKAAK